MAHAQVGKNITYGRDAVPSIAVDPEGSIHSTYSKIRLDEI